MVNYMVVNTIAKCVTHVCFLKHICSMIHQQLYYRAVAILCGEHHWC